MAMRTSTASSASTAGTASTAPLGHPGQTLSWVGDVSLQSQSGLEGAAQAHQGTNPGASEGPASLSHLPGGGLASAASAEPSPRGLGGLARVVASDATSLIALQAAASACKEAGVLTPADLALAGSGNELPPEVARDILEGCDVPGVTEALEVLFKTSRRGLKGTIAL